MKKKFSKAVSLLLAMTMVASMAGCSKKNDDSSNTSTSNNDAATAAPTEEQAASDDSTQESETTEETATTKTLADYDKVTEFNYYDIAAGVETDELNSCATAQLVQEYTGYNVTFDQAPADATDAQTAITNIFMLKSDYQAVKVSKAQFYTLLTSGALLDITEYVDASTNLKEQISEFGWETATQDGKIYGIPQKNALASTSVAICYRQDWLEEYNAANPDTAIPVPSEENGYSMALTDFKTMLTYFATKVPEGGKAMAVDTNGVLLENILPAFGIYQEWADVDGSLEFAVNQPGFEDYMAYMTDLYDSGLIQYQATSSDTGAVAALQARTVGAGRVAHWNANAIEASDEAATDDGIGYITALVPDENRGDASAVRVYATEGYAYYTVLPNYTTAEQAAAVIDWADKKLDKDFFLKMVLGTEGETYSVEDGAYYPILPTFDEKQSLADKFMDGVREEDYAKYWLCRVRKTEAQYKMFSRANYNIDSTGIQNPISVMPPNDTYDTYYTAALTEVKNALVTSFYQTDVTKTLDEIKSVWDANYGSDITTAVNSWYSTWADKDTFNTVLPR